MSRLVSFVCLFVVFKLTFGHPKPETTNLVCPEGQVVSSDQRCVVVPEVMPEFRAPQNQTVLKKKSKKRRRLQKQFAKEIRDIRKMVLEGLEKTHDIPDVSCPAGQEFNEDGICAAIQPGKPNKSQRLQKKLEREVTRVLKKELQNELKRRRRRKGQEGSKKGTPESNKRDDVSKKGTPESNKKDDVSKKGTPESNKKDEVSKKGTPESNKKDEPKKSPEGGKKAQETTRTQEGAPTEDSETPVVA